MTTTLEQMLHSFLDGQRRRQRPSPRQRPSRRDWTDVMCFSCGKSGHAATRCPNFEPQLESHVSMPELAELIHKWPPAVINHMMWRQQGLEQMRKAAKMKYRQKHPAPCTFCGTIIKCDMYRHVAHRHLELAQLWRCPVSWCTVWRGTPQDLMDHIRDAHNVPGEMRKVSLEMPFPPWTVTRQVYAESLTAQNSGISARLDYRWFITIKCTERAFHMLRFVGGIWSSCALSYR